MRTKIFLIVALLLPIISFGQGSLAYKFNGNVSDASGNGNNGTAYSLSYSEGYSESGGSFNGTTSYVSIPETATTDMSGEMTISCWVNSATIAAGARYIVCDASSNGMYSQYALIMNHVGGKLVWTWAGASMIVSKATLSASTWYNIVAVRAGSTGNWIASLYINGEVDSSMTTTTNPHSRQGASVGRSGKYSGYYFYGVIDQMKIDNRAWTASEVKIKYALSTPAEATSAYQLDANSNDVIGSNSMTDLNSPSYSNPGIRGNCVTYNGSNQNSKKSSVSSFSTGDVGLTVSGWIKSTGTGSYTFCFGTNCDNSAYRSALRVWPYYSGSSYVGAGHYGFDNDYSFPTGSVTDGRWHYIVATHVAGGGNASSSFKMYIDGVERPRINTYGTDGAVAIQVKFLVLGSTCNVLGTNSDFYTGSVDEVKFYNSTLNAVQIKNEYALYTGFFQ